MRDFGCARFWIGCHHDGLSSCVSVYLSVFFSCFFFWFCFTVVVAQHSFCHLFCNVRCSFDLSTISLKCSKTRDRKKKKHTKNVKKGAQQNRPMMNTLEWEKRVSNFGFSIWRFVCVSFFCNCIVEWHFFLFNFWSFSWFCIYMNATGILLLFFFLSRSV